MSTDRVIATWGAVTLRTGHPLEAKVEGVQVPVAPLMGYSGALVLELRGPRHQREAFLAALSRSGDLGRVHTEGRRDVLVVPADLQRRVIVGWLAPEGLPLDGGWALVRMRKPWRLVPVRWTGPDTGTALAHGTAVGLDPLMWTVRSPVRIEMSDGRTWHGVRVPDEHWEDAAWSAVLHDTERRVEGRLPPLRGPTIQLEPPPAPGWELGPLRRTSSGVRCSIRWPGLVNGRTALWQVSVESDAVHVAYQTRGAGLWRLHIREDGLTWDPPNLERLESANPGRVLTRAEGQALSSLGWHWPLPAVPNAWRTATQRIGRLARDPQETWWGEELCTHTGWHGISPRFDWQVHLHDLEDTTVPEAIPTWDLAGPDGRGIADGLQWRTVTGSATLFCYASGEVEVAGAVVGVVVVPESRDIFVDTGCRK
ncbi:MAG: hypothetical protein ACP5QO_08575 [Clostridia bacterium]